VINISIPTHKFESNHGISSKQGNFTRKPKIRMEAIITEIKNSIDECNKNSDTDVWGKDQ
jgi:hypothetical protein